MMFSPIVHQGAAPSSHHPLVNRLGGGASSQHRHPSARTPPTPHGPPSSPQGAACPLPASVWSDSSEGVGPDDSPPPSSSSSSTNRSGGANHVTMTPSPPPPSSLAPPSFVLDRAPPFEGVSPESNANMRIEATSPNSMMDMYECLKRKKSAQKPQEELCLVCGDRASGYHYNALTCEGCKGFFRRSITRNNSYECKYGGQCEMDMYMRRKCQFCRFQKCLAVGMRPECVVPEKQCKAKRLAKEKNKPNSTTGNGIISNSSSPDWCALPDGLCPDHQELIRKLVFYQDQFELPPEEEVKKITPFLTTDGDIYAKFQRFSHCTELTILVTQLIVEFTKRLPGFQTLLREDQITLLKAAVFELMVLRTARRYDLETDCVVFANNIPYTRENYKSANIGEISEAQFDFCRSMAVMKVDNAEYALLSAVVIFSDRPCLIEPDKVEKVQEMYLDALRNYVELQRAPQANVLARLLMKLTELRTISSQHSDMLFSLKLKDHKLPPLLSEIWDVKQ